MPVRARRSIAARQGRGRSFASLVMTTISHTQRQFAPRPPTSHIQPPSRLFTAPLVRPELVMRPVGLTGFVLSALILSTTSTSAQRAATMAGRSPVYAPNGVAATSQPLATTAALNVLEHGGNAI